MLPVNAKQVPSEIIGGKTLFATPDGKFFNKKGKELKPTYTPNRPSRKSGGHANYMRMRQYCDKCCHVLIYETFIGRRIPEMQIDHINGVPTDNSADNLQLVTPAENIKRAKILRALRKAGRNPQDMSREQLLELFSKYEFLHTDPFERMDKELKRHQEC